MKNHVFLNLRILPRLAFAIALTACGEKPSFTDRVNLIQENSADSIGEGVSTGTDTNTSQTGSPQPGGTLPTPPAPAPAPAPAPIPGDNPGQPQPPKPTPPIELPPEGGPVPPPPVTPEPLPPPGPMDPPKPTRRTVTTESTFPAYITEDGVVEKEFGNPLLLHQFTMVKPDLKRKKTVQQSIRPAYMDRLEQVPTGQAVTERFGQMAERNLDILLVVDDSPSMKDNQANLSTKLSALLSSVEKTNWAIGVTTTGCQEGCLNSLIKKGDLDAKARFSAAVTPGTRGNWVEKGLLNAVRSLSSACMTEPWIRKDSTLAVVFVSDEDNCSNGKQCGNKPHASANYLLDFLSSIREPGKNARVYGIIWHPNIPADQCKEGKHIAKTYAELITATKGTYGNICANDYSQALTQISKDMLDSLNAQFTLKFDPDPTSVRIFVNNNEIKQGITIQGRSITITPPPPDGAAIAINYRYDVKPPQTTFKLRFGPYDGRAIVTVNGAIVSPTEYVINPGEALIDFIIPPPVGAKITVAYFGNVDFKTGFTVGEEIKPGSLTVKINGVTTQDYTVAEPMGIITFITAPAEGANIEFSYSVIGSPLYRYPFTAPPGTPADLDAFDTVTLVPIRVTYANGIMTVNSDEFIEGRKVTVRFQDPSQKTYDIPVPQNPLPGSVRVSSGSLICPPSNIVIVGQNVNVKNCNFPDNVTSARVDYRFIAASYQEFTLKLEKIPGPTDYQVWTVWVNDVVTTAYTRTLNVIQFPQPLPYPSFVRIQVVQNEF